MHTAILFVLTLSPAPAGCDTTMTMKRATHRSNPVWVFISSIFCTNIPPVTCKKSRDSELFSVPGKSVRIQLKTAHASLYLSLITLQWHSEAEVKLPAKHPGLPHRLPDCFPSAQLGSEHVQASPMISLKTTVEDGHPSASRQGKLPKSLPFSLIQRMWTLSNLPH